MQHSFSFPQSMKIYFTFKSYNLNHIIEYYKHCVFVYLLDILFWNKKLCFSKKIILFIKWWIIINSWRQYLHWTMDKEFGPQWTLVRIIPINFFLEDNKLFNKLFYLFNLFLLILTKLIYLMNNRLALWPLLILYLSKIILKYILNSFFIF